MRITQSSNKEYFKYPMRAKCPKCGESIVAPLISAPIISQVIHFKPQWVGLVYMCPSCDEPYFTKHFVPDYYSDDSVEIDSYGIPVEHRRVDYDFTNIPPNVAQDFQEALECYSIGTYNAFGAMCRRTVQSMTTELGAKGSSKIKTQLAEAKEFAKIDNDTFTILEQIVIDGHDGTHPHLPSLSPERAEILLVMMKDVLHQIFKRMAKVTKSNELRQNEIDAKKKTRQ